MRITAIDCHILVDPDYDPSATSSAQDDFVVEVHTDEGISGIGESDINPWIARACVEAPGTHTMDQGLGSVLIGMDPLAPEETWQTAYRATAMAGRRGALVNALGAIDMALWDIRGKAAGVPAWQLMGPQRPDPARAYASLEPEVANLDDYITSMVRWAGEAKRLGFSAVKAEATFSGPYANMGLREPDDSMTKVLQAVRGAIGSETGLMVDVQYCFDSVDRARKMIGEWEDLELLFVETPLWIDDLDGYRELAESVSTPIAAGEWQATRFEFRDLVERGRVSIVQPDIGRCGGLSEALAIVADAEASGTQVVPHVWKTGISLAAAAHLATVSPNMPYFEFLHPDMCHSQLRKRLVHDEIELRADGSISTPTRPGLGVEIDRDALSDFTRAAARLTGL